MWLSVSVSVLVASPTGANVVQDTAVHKQQATKKPITNIPRLSDIVRQNTSVKYWFAQELAPNQVTIVTGVSLSRNNSGAELILETPTSNLLRATASTKANTWSAIIENAQLRYKGGNTFVAKKPIPGITEIKVINVDTNRIEVTVTGEASLPKVEAFDSNQGLIFSVTPSVSSTQPPQTVKPSEEPIELVVTAEKTEEDPQNVPISLTVLPREELEDAQVNSVRDIAANTPNFFTSLGDRAFNFQTIRGLGNSNYLVRDAISFYIDDVPYENVHQYLPGELFDLERVEVLRGPQGTLYGRNSQAGVVNIISRPPSNTPEFRIGGAYGNFNQRQVQLSWSDAIIKDKLAFRLSGSYNARDGFTENTLLREDANPQSSLYGRANILWTPSKEWTISFNANAASNNDGDNTFVPINQRDRFKIVRNIPGFLDVSINTQSLRIAYEGSAVNVTSITARNDTNLDYQQDTDYSPDDLIRSTTNIPSTIWSQEIRVQSPKSAERFRWLVGGYYQSRSFDLFLSTQYTPLGASQFGLPAAGTNRTNALFDQQTYSVFGQVDVQPIDALTLTAGLRYEKFRDELNRNRTFETLSGGRTNGLTLTDSITEGDIVLPRFTVQYRFNPSISVYGSIARGYKPGTQNYSTDNPALRLVRPEKLWSYELGVKSNWLGDRLIANLAVFWNKVDDYQLLLPDSRGFASDIANGEVEANGVELEFRAKPFQGFDLIAGFGYTNAEFTRYTNPFTGQNFNGNRPTYSPEYTYNLALQYRSPGGIFSRVELQGLGTYFFNDANTVKQDPFALVNTRIGYEGKNYGIYLYVNNIFDERYVTTAFRAPNTLVSYGDRRTFGFQVRANF